MGPKKRKAPPARKAKPPSPVAEEEDSDDDDESEESESLQRRELPKRSTRGYISLGAARGERGGGAHTSATGDDVFDDTSDDDDDEWVAGADDVDADSFDEDFWQTDDEGGAEGSGEEAEDSVRLVERADRAKRKKFDYEKIAKARMKKHRSSAREWSVLSGKIVDRSSGKPFTQTMLLAEAKKTELANMARLALHEDAIRAATSDSIPGAGATGTAAQKPKYVSGYLTQWASLLYTPPPKPPGEAAAPRLVVAQDTRVYSEVMIFRDFSNPTTLLPPIFNSRKSEQQPQPPVGTGNAGTGVTQVGVRLYMDPVTRKLFSNAQEFNQLRKG